MLNYFQSNIGFLARELHKVLSSSLDKRMQSLSINYKQAGILWICSKQEISQSGLCELVGADKNYVRMYIDDLENKGYVKRVKNPNNRRENFLKLTQKGKKVAKETFVLAQEVNKEILLLGLSEDELETLHSLLYRANLALFNSSFKHSSLGNHSTKPSKDLAKDFSKDSTIPTNPNSSKEQS